MQKFACATKTGDFSINCRPAFSAAVFGVTSRYPGHPTLLFWPAAPPECALHYFPRPTWHRHERGGVRLFRHFHHRFQISHTGQPATRETRSSGLAACPSSGGGTRQGRTVTPDFPFHPRSDAAASFKRTAEREKTRADRIVFLFCFRVECDSCARSIPACYRPRQPGPVAGRPSRVGGSAPEFDLSQQKQKTAHVARSVGKEARGGRVKGIHN